MSNLVQIFNIKVNKFGQSIAICDKHLRQLRRRLNDYCFVSIIGSTKDKCRKCEDKS